MAWELSDKAWYHRDRNPDSSHYYAKKALFLAKKVNLKKIIAYSLTDIGMYHVFQGQPERGLDSLYKSLKTRRTYGDTVDILSALNNIGILYGQIQIYDSATSVFLKGIALSQSTINAKMEGVLLNGLSSIYLNTGNYSQAEETIKRSLEIAKQQKDSTALAKRYQTLGNLYQKMKRPGLALQNFHRAGVIYKDLDNALGQTDIEINQAAVLLQTFQYKKAIERLNQALHRSIQDGYLDNLPSIHNNLGLAYQGIGMTDSALSKLQKGVSIAQNRNRDVIELRLNLLQLKADLDQFNEIIPELPKLYRKIKDSFLPQYLPEFYILRSRVYAGLGNFEKAFQDRMAYSVFQDSLEQKIDETQRVLAAMETSQRDKEILRKENELQKSELHQRSIENRNHLLLTSLIILGLLTISLVFFFRWRNIRIKNKALAEKKKSDERLQNVLHDVDMQLLEARIEANKKISFKIGQDLHDNMGSKLAVIQMSMDGIRSKISSNDQDMDERFQQIEQLLEESCNDLRNIAHDLQDRELKHRGLVQEIELYTRLINKAEGLRIHFMPGRIPEHMRESSQKEIIAIARLLLENAIRHAKAKDINIKLFKDDKSLTLSIEDNGCGFFPSIDETKDGRGLPNARLRTEKLAGQFELLSKPGLGTKATLTIPLKNL